MTSATALLITRDESLRDDVLRLAAAAGTVLDVAQDASGAMRAWTSASVVLLGADQVAVVAAQRPVRREQVHVVGRAPVADGLFREALAAGATDVVELPAADAWLVEVLTDMSDGGTRTAVTVGVVGGSGGAGATTLGCALAVTAAARTPALLMDLDPLGPGVDRVIGLDDVAGVRWDSLVESSGRLGSRSLREALPHKERLAVLTWAAAVGQPLQEASVHEVLGAAQRGNDVVVVDLPRQPSEVTREVVSRCDHVVLVSTLNVAGIAAAGRVAAHLQELTGRVHLLTRGGSCALSPDEVARTLGLPLIATMSDQRRLAEHIDLGLGPVHAHRGPLARAARAVCDRLVPAASVAT